MDKRIELQVTQNYWTFSTEFSHVTARIGINGLEVREMRVKTADVEVVYTPDRVFVVTPVKVLKFKTEGEVITTWETIIHLLDDASVAFSLLEGIIQATEKEKEVARREILEFGLYLDEEESVEDEEPVEDEEEAVTN
jgi:hypothetical protein